MRKKQFPTFFLTPALLPASVSASGTQKSINMGSMTFSAVLTTSYYGSQAD